MRGVIFLLSLILCVLFIVAVPLAAWTYLVPVLFWQKFAMIVGIVFYESIVCPLAFVLEAGVMAVLYGA